MGGGGQSCGPLLLQEYDIEAITNNFNEVMTEVTTDIVGFSGPKPQPWTIDDIVNMCDTRRLLKPQRKNNIGKTEYGKVNKQLKEGMKHADRSGVSRGVFWLLGNPPGHDFV